MSDLRISSFDFDLPSELIAQMPVRTRDRSRLLIVDRSTKTTRHCAYFNDILACFTPGDVLVLNNSRVIPARLRGRKSGSGGEIELLLLEELTQNNWWTLLRPGKRVRVGTRIEFPTCLSVPGLHAVVLEKNSEGHCRLLFSDGVAFSMAQVLEEIGEIPLPPYITRSADNSDRERYQTVYADAPGSIAAPTAGLHFTHEMLAAIRYLGVEIYWVTLHVGLGTFAPMKAATVAAHTMHEERFELSSTTARGLNEARAQGRRIIAAGTTTVRVLESVAADNDGVLHQVTGRTRIFIYPPYRFRIVDALVTNFHLPRSTLLMLVSAFAAPGETTGRELMLSVYAEAIRQRYRFFSYGDAMLIL